MSYTPDGYELGYEETYAEAPVEDYYMQEDGSSFVPDQYYLDDSADFTQYGAPDMSFYPQHPNTFDGTMPAGPATGDTPATQEERYVCPDCNRAFSKPHKLRKHQKTHDPSVDCPAEVSCPFKTAERRDMDRHLWVAHKSYAEHNNIENPGAKCDRCGKWFTRRYNLQRHLNEGRCRPGEEDDD
ncbi:hypothetical protein GE09DRAFT_1232063 [Coniochaeta sp. 2T2.1]|nr:hypothetical protein GE09DRAFT_1232063 [Coniochaeta sp. 2T2.1]